jgi:hypothetical protein
MNTISNRTDIYKIIAQTNCVVLSLSPFSNRFDCSCLVGDTVLIHDCNQMINPSDMVLFGTTPHRIYIVMQNKQIIKKHYDGYPFIINHTINTSLYIVGYDIHIYLDQNNPQTPLFVDRADQLIDCTITIERKNDAIVLGKNVIGNDKRKSAYPLFDVDQMMEMDILRGLVVNCVSEHVLNCKINLLGSCEIVGNTLSGIVGGFIGNVDGLDMRVDGSVLFDHSNINNCGIVGGCVDFIKNIKVDITDSLNIKKGISGGLVGCCRSINGTNKLNVKMIRSTDVGKMGFGLITGILCPIKDVNKPDDEFTFDLTEGGILREIGKSQQSTYGLIGSIDEMIIGKFVRKINNQIHQPVISQKIMPKQIVPQQIVPQQIVPQQIVPKQIVPQQIVPQQIVPQQIVPQKENSQKVISNQVITKSAPKPVLLKTTVTEKSNAKPIIRSAIKKTNTQIPKKTVHYSDDVKNGVKDGVKSVKKNLNIFEKPIAEDIKKKSVKTVGQTISTTIIDKISDDLNESEKKKILENKEKQTIAKIKPTKIVVRFDVSEQSINLSEESMNPFSPQPQPLGSKSNNGSRENLSDIQSDISDSPDDIPINLSKTSKESDVSEEQLDISEEQLDISEEQLDVSEESSNISEEQLDVSEESSNVSEEQLDMSEEQLDVSEEQLDMSEEQLDVSEEQLDVSEEQLDISEESSSDKTIFGSLGKLININVTDMIKNIIKIPVVKMSTGSHNVNGFQDNTKNIEINHKPKFDDVEFVNMHFGNMQFGNTQHVNIQHVNTLSPNDQINTEHCEKKNILQRKRVNKFCDIDENILKIIISST